MALRLRIDGIAPESADTARTRESFTSQLNTDATITPRSLSSGKLLSDSINEGIADTATQAAAAVLDIRERERDLLQQSADRAYGDGTITRQDGAADYEAEIARITSNATYNGVNALSGRTLTLDSQSEGIHEAIGLASFSGAATTSVRFSNQTPENAYADLEIIKAAASSASDLVGSYESAAEKAKTSGEPSTISFDTFVPSTVRNGDEAQELARKIAASVVSPYATERQKLSLIEMSSAALEEDTVYRLIA